MKEEIDFLKGLRSRTMLSRPTQESKSPHLMLYSYSLNLNPDGTMLFHGGDVNIEVCLKPIGGGNQVVAYVYDSELADKLVKKGNKHPYEGFVVAASFIKDLVWKARR